VIFIPFFITSGNNLNLLVFNGLSCCDTPVSSKFGFPYVGLGATLTQHYLSEPILAYWWRTISISMANTYLQFIGDILFVPQQFLVLAFCEVRP
jgi:hypothetical protein